MQTSGEQKPKGLGKTVMHTVVTVFPCSSSTQVTGHLPQCSSTQHPTIPPSKQDMLACLCSPLLHGPDASVHGEWGLTGFISRTPLAWPGSTWLERSTEEAGGGWPSLTN